MFYDNFRAVCKEKGTTVSAVLNALGKSTGSTGKWKNGSYPSLDIVMAMADYLDVSLDKLVYNQDSSLSIESVVDQEWIDIISRIPEEKQKLCKDFLRTHMVIPEKFEGQETG